ncbi:MAG: hypothetical protein FWH11_01345 [Micrococcales bacterium]|nr:hypothetical protein [Micrococcales bacterium]
MIDIDTAAEVLRYHEIDADPAPLAQAIASGVTPDHGWVVAADGRVVGTTFRARRNGVTVWYVDPQTLAALGLRFGFGLGLEAGLALGQIRHALGGVDVAHVRPGDVTGAGWRVRAARASAAHEAQIASLTGAAASGDQDAAAKLRRMADNGDWAAQDALAMVAERRHDGGTPSTGG